MSLKRSTLDEIQKFIKDHPDKNLENIDISSLPNNLLFSLLINHYNSETIVNNISTDSVIMILFLQNHCNHFFEHHVFGDKLNIFLSYLFSHSEDEIKEKYRTFFKQKHNFEYIGEDNQSYSMNQNFYIIDCNFMYSLAHSLSNNHSTSYELLQNILSFFPNFYKSSVEGKGLMYKLLKSKIRMHKNFSGAKAILKHIGNQNETK